jgi:hypothetical protein
LASHDLAELEIVTQIRDLYQHRPEAERDERWQRDWGDIPRTARSAVEKIAAQHQANGSGNGENRDDPWDDQPVSELDQPDPLIASQQPQASFPLDRLPAEFADVVRALSRLVEAHPSLAASVVLATMALVTGRLAVGVAVEDGLVFVIALYIAAIVNSSERKTSAERRSFVGCEEFINGELEPDYKLQLREYNADLAIYEQQKRAILGRLGRRREGQAAAASKDEDDGGFDTGDVGSGDAKAALMGLEEPVPPKLPVLITNDATVEGVRDTLAANYGQLAVVTSEAGAVLQGYSLNDMSRRGAGAASLSRFWDGMSEVVIRAGRRVIAVHEPRVSMCLGVQPRIARTFFADIEMVDQGITSRFLVTWPEPLAGTRHFSPSRPDDLAALRAFNDRAQACLRRAYGKDGGQVGGQSGQDEPREALTLTDEARAVWRDYAKTVERGQAKGEPYETIRGWAGKCAEQAARVAAILTLFTDPTATTVGLEAMRAGIAVANWYLHEWLRVSGVVEPQPEVTLASRVLEWLRANYGRKAGKDTSRAGFTARDIYRNNVAGIATREPADQVLEILAKHGEIETSDPPKLKKAGRPPLVRWRLIVGASEQTCDDDPTKRQI